MVLVVPVVVVSAVCDGDDDDDADDDGGDTVRVVELLSGDSRRVVDDDDLSAPLLDTPAVPDVSLSGGERNASSLSAGTFRTKKKKKTEKKVRKHQIFHQNQIKIKIKIVNKRKTTTTKRIELNNFQMRISFALIKLFFFFNKIFFFTGTVESAAFINSNDALAFASDLNVSNTRNTNVTASINKNGNAHAYESKRKIRKENKKIRQ